MARARWLCLLVLVSAPMLARPPLATAAQKVASPPNSSALRIVVVEGEDAVNIVQQKTAVAPVVEVRDRNDQPIAGVAVRFAVRHGRATFSGARNLTVVTNAAGRAAATGLVPTGNGALQIGATAAFQGQTAAVTIAQTNVMTLAQAAAVSSAGASGGGGAGASASAGGATGGGTGGGLSATTIGIVGGAAAAGTAVAVKEIGGGGAGATQYTGQFNGALLMTFPGPLPCTRTENQTGTITMEVTNDNGAISGTAHVEGTIALVPGPCTPSTTDSFGFGNTALSGTTGNLTFTANASNRFSGPGGSGVNAYTYTFTGTLNSGQITGTLMVARTITNDLGGAPGTGSVVYNVTLR